MNIRLLSTVLALWIALPALPAGATDSYDYARDEYAIISGGLAPDKTLSLAAHEGDGEDFHVWLMAEPAHRRIEALQAIGSDNNLDTAPRAYFAQWSNDSRRAAVTFRSDRLIYTLNLYSFHGGKARLVTGPSLFRQVAGRETTEADDMRRLHPELAWRGPSRFTLSENRLFLTRDTGFAKRLTRYAQVAEKLGDGRLAVEFAAEADCMMTSDHRYRIVDVRPGKFRFEK